MQKSKLFARVRVRLDELHDEGVLDFAELLKKNAPAEDRAREERETVAEPRQAAPALRSDGIEGDDMSDGNNDQHGQQKPKKGRNIFESIIAKWSSLSAPGQARDSDEDDNGALSGGAGNTDIDSDDYDYDDGLIDNSELEQKLISRAIAKHKHKKQRTAGGGFRIDTNLDDDENEEEGDEDEDDDEEEGGEDEEMGKSQGGSRAKESGSGTAPKSSGYGASAEVPADGAVDGEAPAAQKSKKPRSFPFAKMPPSYRQDCGVDPHNDCDLKAHWFGLDREQQQEILDKFADELPIPWSKCPGKWKTQWHASHKDQSGDKDEDTVQQCKREWGAIDAVEQHRLKRELGQQRAAK